MTINPNITINITATTPEAVAALLNGLGLIQPTAQQPQTPAPAPVSAVPTTAPVSAPEPVVPTAPAPQAPAEPAPAVPVTAPPAYTFDVLAKAAAPLMDAGKTAELQALLRSFNVQALTQLSQDQYGAFATKLRELGAKI